MNAPKTFIAIPTYNEAENISSLIGEIFRRVPAVFVLVADDDSPDGTGRTVRAMKEKYPNLFLLERKGVRGFATAYRAAFDEILRDPAVEYIVTMDADFSHHPRYLPALLDAGRSCDLAIGSRYAPGGGIKNWSAHRRLLSMLGNRYARLVTGMPCRDITAGFSCIRAEFLRTLPWRAMHSQGYAFLIELKMLFFRAGGHIREIPIIFEERRMGHSKISKSIIMEGILGPLRMRFFR